MPGIPTRIRRPSGAQGPCRRLRHLMAAEVSSLSWADGLPHSPTLAPRARGPLWRRGARTTAGAKGRPSYGQTRAGRGESVGRSLTAPIHPDLRASGFRHGPRSWTLCRSRTPVDTEDPVRGSHLEPRVVRCPARALDRQSGDSFTPCRGGHPESESTSAASERWGEPSRPSSVWP